MKEVTVQELKAKMDGNEEFQLIDVREQYERDICNLGGEHFPMGEILSFADSIRRDAPVIVHCRSGMRSAASINALELNLGLGNLYNLKGGILAFADEIDPSLEKY